MCGFFIGALFFFGFAKLMRHRHGGGGCGGRRWGRRSRRGRRGRGRDRGPVMFLSRELDLDNEQRDVVSAEVDGLFDKVQSMRPVLARTRSDMADILRSETLSENDLAAMFERHDDALRELHHDAGARLGRLHVALDPDQRRALADLLERGLGRGLGGPFRGGI